MKKKDGVIVLLIGLLLASTSISAINNQVDLSDDIRVLNENVKDYLKITEPNIGELSIFGTRFCIHSLVVLKLGVVINFELNIKTNSSKTIDYVIFTVTSLASSVTNKTNIYKINASNYPFSCSFKDIPTKFNYIINATAYNNSKLVAWDEVYTIAFIKIPLYITP